MTYKPEFLARITERRAALRTELAALLPAGRPLVWEIGSGHGHFLVQYAQAFPEKFCVGVDIIRDRLNRSGKKRDRAKLTNCHFVQAEAREFFDALPASTTLQEIWVLFPDPWPKKRHHKRRLLQPAFVALLASRIAPGGYLHCATDWQEYAAQMLEVLGAEPGLKNTCADYAPRPDYRPQTKFETRGLRLGHGVWDLIFKRA